MSRFFEVENLARSFGGVKAVQDVSFWVNPAEVLAIIGPNGAGKTSVFNLITRVFDPSAGSVRLNGQEILEVPRHDVVRHGIARTFQNIELFEGASVLDNLLLGCHHKLHGSWHGNLLSNILFLPRTRSAEVAARAHVEDIIELLDLTRYRQSVVSQLPYGVRKVVELARALATDPALLLLDEPASGLNPQETEELGHWIHEIRDRLGMTIVMIEHDMSLVASVADRVVVMDQGAVLTVGTAVEVQSDPRVITAYLGA